MIFVGGEVPGFGNRVELYSMYPGSGLAFAVQRCLEKGPWTDFRCSTCWVITWDTLNEHLEIEKPNRCNLQASTCSPHYSSLRLRHWSNITAKTCIHCFIIPPSLASSHTRTIPLIVDAGCSGPEGNTDKLVIRDSPTYTGMKQNRVTEKSPAGTVVNSAYYGEGAGGYDGGFCGKSQRENNTNYW